MRKKKREPIHIKALSSKAAATSITEVKTFTAITSKKMKHLYAIYHHVRRKK